jgi:hypothetical protein
MLAAAPQEKFHLTRRARIGDVSRTLTEATMSAGMNGLVMTMTVREIDKVTITAVDDDGTITARAEAVAGEMVIGGQTRPSPPQDPTTFVVRPDGSLISYGQNGAGAVEARIHTGTHVVFAGTSVGVGDSWTREIKADPATGAQAASAEYKVIAFEKVGETHTAKIAFSFRELGEDAIVVSGAAWIETSTGEQVKSEYELKNLTISPGLLATANVKVTRTEVNPE